MRSPLGPFGYIQALEFRLRFFLLGNAPSTYGTMESNLERPPRSPSPTTKLTRGVPSPNCVPQGHILVSLKCPWGWGHHHHHPPAPVLHHPLHEEILPNAQSKPLFAPPETRGALLPEFAQNIFFFPLSQTGLPQILFIYLFFPGVKKKNPSEDEGRFNYFQTRNMKILSGRCPSQQLYRLRKKYLICKF